MTGPFANDAWPDKSALKASKAKTARESVIMRRIEQDSADIGAIRFIRSRGLFLLDVLKFLRVQLFRARDYFRRLI